jgi:F-type H+-transporting ATPase subunit gamma
MASSRKILSRIKSAKNIAQITKAMQMVSASKMKKAQDLALSGEPYSQEMRRILISLLSTATKFNHPLLGTNTETDRKLCLFVTTNKGLCGGLNTNHFREIMRWYRQNPNTDFVTIGKRGKMFLASMNANIIADFSDLTETIEFTDAIPIAQLILEEFQKGNYHKVFFSYNQFISTLSQKPVRFQILPIDVNELKDSLGLLEELTEEETRKFEPKRIRHRARQKTDHRLAATLLCRVTTLSLFTGKQSLRALSPDGCYEKCQRKCQRSAESTEIGL